MTDEPILDKPVIDSELLRGMAAAVGVNLAGDRASTLVPQAEQHFAQLRSLDEIAASSIEPATELRLDRWKTRQ